jgi:hypothetical protein
MKIRFLKLFILESIQRRGVTLLLCVGLTVFACTSGVAQVRNQRRVTGLQLGDSAEGARVTIVSDSALTDYEAFRRGEFFYVKIPLADFTSAAPNFRAAGLESLHVQKVGDGLVVSFKLQPGATARVDQHGNRLEVIFSAPNRGSNNAANTGRDSRTSDQGRDTAGPMPPGSVAASRVRVVTEGPGDGNESRTPQNPWVSANPQNDSNRSSKGSARDQSTSGVVSVPSPLPHSSPSPRSSPSSVLTSGTPTSYSPLTSATPALSPASRPADNASGAGGFLNLKRRSTAALQWAATNRLATLLGALILLSLILYLAMALRSRQKKVAKEKRAKAPKVQPKYSAAGELKEVSGPSLRERAAPHLKDDLATSRAGSELVSDRATRPNQVPDQRDIREHRPANAPASSAKMSSSDEWVLTRPTIASPTAAHDEQNSEEEEREVFEL